MSTAEGRQRTPPAESPAWFIAAESWWVAGECTRFGIAGGLPPFQGRHHCAGRRTRRTLSGRSQRRPACSCCSRSREGGRPFALDAYDWQKPRARSPSLGPLDSAESQPVDETIGRVVATGPVGARPGIPEGLRLSCPPPCRAIAQRNRLCLRGQACSRGRLRLVARGVSARRTRWTRIGPRRMACGRSWQIRRPRTLRRPDTVPDRRLRRHRHQRRRNAKPATPQRPRTDHHRTDTGGRTRHHRRPPTRPLTPGCSDTRHPYRHRTRRERSARLTTLEPNTPTPATPQSRPNGAADRWMRWLASEFSVVPSRGPR